VLAISALGVLLLSTAALSLPQNGRGGKRANPAQPRAEDPAARGEKLEAFKKALAENKTSLVEAIGLAEAEKKGVAFSGQIRLGKNGKLKIAIDLMVDGKPVEVVVDPETKKVITPMAKEQAEAPGSAPEKKEGG
jgi:hypothetical protein